MKKIEDDEAEYERKVVFFDVMASVVEALFCIALMVLMMFSIKKLYSIEREPTNARKEEVVEIVDLYRVKGNEENTYYMVIEDSKGKKYDIEIDKMLFTRYKVNDEIEVVIKNNRATIKSD